jgi:SAM-dependent methyltransferase
MSVRGRLNNLQSDRRPPPRVNLGCGRLVLPGFVNVDFLPGEGVDVVVDFDHDPLPFANESVNAVLASHVVEHIAHLERLFSEVHRVLAPGGILEVYTPFGRNRTFQHVRFIWPSSVRRYVNESQNPERYHFVPEWRIALMETTRSLPFQWHVRKYLRIDPKIGLRRELHFVLERVR